MDHVLFPDLCRAPAVLPFGGDQQLLGVHYKYRIMVIIFHLVGCEVSKAGPALDALSVCLEASFKIMLTQMEFVVEHLATVIPLTG